MALEASGKYAMSTASAMLSSSSSQSRMLSWQPSHEANFQTASLGLRFGAISNLPFSKPFFDAIVSKDGAVFADEERPELAVSTEADAALHVAFH